MNNITTQDGKLNFTRLFFKKSKNKKGEDCYIGKVKQYVTKESGGKQFNGDTIVIANLFGSQKCNIDREGRWDVRCKKMEKGNGYVVVDANYTQDTLTISTGDFFAKFLINGREEKLKTEDGKYIPLSFDCDKYYDPEIIVENIERKLKYLQLPENFSFDGFMQDFLENCSKVHKAYCKREMPENEKISEDALNKLKANFGSK